MTVPFILVFIVPPIAALAIGWWAVRRQERALAATRVANLEDVVISAAPDARWGKAASNVSMTVTIHRAAPEVAGPRHGRHAIQSG